jgi:hypothetical protein
MRLNFDPTKVQLFPELPETIRTLWEQWQREMLDNFPRLASKHRTAVLMRRLQERMCR